MEDGPADWGAGIELLGGGFGGGLHTRGMVRTHLDRVSSFYGAECLDGGASLVVTVAGGIRSLVRARLILLVLSLHCSQSQ